jgi:hypothetical protein
MLSYILDVDECTLQPGLCRNGTCDNKIGGYECNCNPGFKLSVNQDCEGMFMTCAWNMFV